MCGFRKDANKRFREAIFDAWEHRCAYCGDTARSLDHIRPRSKGGHTTDRNLVPACCRCNGSKGSQNWVEWYRKQPAHSIEREKIIEDWIHAHDVTEKKTGQF